MLKLRITRIKTTFTIKSTVIHCLIPWFHKLFQHEKHNLNSLYIGTTLRMNAFYVSGYCPLSSTISLIAKAWESIQSMRKGIVGRNSEPWWLRQWNAVLINCFLSQILPLSSCVMLRSHKQPFTQKDAIFILSLFQISCLCFTVLPNSDLCILEPLETLLWKWSALRS